MKVLEVTFIPPDTMSGGGRGILQSMKSIIANAHMDYIGPKFNMSILDGAEGANEIGNRYFLTASRQSVLMTVKGLIHGATTSFYESWVSISSALDWNEYDCIHIESSRYDFVVKDAQAHSIPLVLRLHNIEKDYGYNEYKRHRCIGNYIRYKSYGWNERRCITKADNLIFITRKDEARAEQLYGKIGGKHELNPVCMDENMIDINKDRESNQMFAFLITGTLSFGPNSNGIKWFIDNVWKSVAYRMEAKLIVAGSNPSVEMKALTSECSGVELVDTPKDMMPYLMRANAYIAPIFDGAGMKVKVAEALSYGLPVIGTNHAWIGYEQIQSGRYEANTSQQFIDAMNNICKSKINYNRIKDDFNRNYSMTASKERYRELLNSLEHK